MAMSNLAASVMCRAFQILSRRSCGDWALESIWIKEKSIDWEGTYGRRQLNLEFHLYNLKCYFCTEELWGRIHEESPLFNVKQDKLFCLLESCLSPGALVRHSKTWHSFNPNTCTCGPYFPRKTINVCSLSSDILQITWYYFLFKCSMRVLIRLQHTKLIC